MAQRKRAICKKTRSRGVYVSDWVMDATESVAVVAVTSTGRCVLLRFVLPSEDLDEAIANAEAVLIQRDPLPLRLVQ